MPELNKHYREVWQSEWYGCPNYLHTSALEAWCPNYQQRIVMRVLL